MKEREALNSRLHPEKPQGRQVFYVHDIAFVTDKPLKF